MIEVHGIEPPKSAKGYSLAKKLVGLVGAESAMKMAGIYPYIKNKFYAQKGYPFELMVSDHMAIIPLLDFEAKAPEREEKKLERSKTEDDFFKSMGF
jgi:hypothetical protein